MIKLFSSFRMLLDARIPLALPLGDGKSILQRAYNIIPRKSGSIKVPHFQEMLKEAHYGGKWIPKVYQLPNVGQFEISLNSFNPALLANGVITRYPSEVTLYQGRNRKMNRYLSYMQYRLFSNIGNPKRYWVIANLLIRHSSVYLIAMQHSVDRNIYRKMDLDSMTRLYKRLIAMRATLKTLHNREMGLRANGISEISITHYIKFFRVYIPKGESSHRPLGVPTRAWRIFLKCWLIPLMGFTGDKMPDGFHGYLPNRGCPTAWKQIVRKVLRSDNIYEVDFKQFFPSVPTDQLMMTLYKCGMPLATLQWFYLVNQSLPLFLTEKSKDKLPNETRWTSSHNFSYLAELEKTGKKRPYWADVTYLADGETEETLAKKEKINYQKPRTWDELMKLGALDPRPAIRKSPLWGIKKGGPINYKFVKGLMKNMVPHKIQIPSSLSHRPLSAIPKDNFTVETLKQQLFLFGGKGNIGLPQGSGLSPYLSILYLQDCLEQIGIPEGVNYLFYADDGLFYSDNYQLLKEFLEKLFKPDPKDPQCLAYYNIWHHPDKSSWAKTEGNYLKTIKFLGLIFVPGENGQPGYLVAETRSGKSKLKLDCYELLQYSHESAMIQGIASYNVKDKLATLKGYKQTKLTKLFVAYYEQILLAQEYFRERDGAILDYMYLLFKCAREGIHIFTYLFITGASYLSNNNGELNLFTELKKETMIWITPKVDKEDEYDEIEDAMLEEELQMGSKPGEKIEKMESEYVKEPVLKLPILEAHPAFNWYEKQKIKEQVKQHYLLTSEGEPSLFGQFISLVDYLFRARAITKIDVDASQYRLHGDKGFVTQSLHQIFSVRNFLGLTGDIPKPDMPKTKTGLSIQRQIDQEVLRLTSEMEDFVDPIIPETTLGFVEVAGMLDWNQQEKPKRQKLFLQLMDQARELYNQAKSNPTLKPTADAKYAYAKEIEWSVQMIDLNIAGCLDKLGRYLGLSAAEENGHRTQASKDFKLVEECESLLFESLWEVFKATPAWLEGSIFPRNYLSRYYHKWHLFNFVNSRYYGLIFSRLYIGSWLMEDYSQNFRYTCEDNSLASYMRSKMETPRDLNIFNGSSYALHESVRLVTFLSERTNKPFRLFASGYLPPDSWDVEGKETIVNSKVLSDKKT